MGLEKMIKREISITIATVLLVTIVFLMLSYAIFKVDVSGNTNVINFGDVSMSFCTDSTCAETVSNVGNIIGTEPDGDSTRYVPIYPAKKAEREDMTTEENPTWIWTMDDYKELKPYSFIIKNTGDLSLYVTLFLNRDTTAGLKYTYNQNIDGVDYTQEFNNPVTDDQIMIAVGERGSLPTPKFYYKTEKDATAGNIIATGIELKPDESKTIDLYVWLRSDAQNAAQGKFFVSQISARGEFIPE